MYNNLQVAYFENSEESNNLKLLKETLINENDVLAYSFVTIYVYMYIC